MSEPSLWGPAWPRHTGAATPREPGYSYSPTFHSSLTPLRGHQISLALHWSLGENSFPFVLLWLVRAKFFLLQS